MKAIRIIVVDLKGDFAHIPQELGEPWDHYSYHDGLHFGLNSPSPDLPTNIWINQVTKIIAARCGLILSASCLAAMMRVALAAMNPTPSGALRWPSLRLLYEIARSTPLEVFAAKPDSYGRTLLQVLENLIGIAGDFFETFSGFNAVEHVVKPGRCAGCTTVAVRVE